MATSPLFGWEEPDDVDLVKDGAAAIRTLGNAIDTSMGDLLGGTTGQILSKASNTNMDFTWIANDQGDITGITASSPLTGGGTSGAVTIGILNGTTSNLGAVQLSDSTSSTSTTLAATANAVKAAYDLANAAIPKSLVDAAGDLLLGTADNTVGRLAIGANNTYLKSNGTTASWAAIASSSPSFSLLGSAALTGAQTVTVSGLSGYSTLWAYIEGSSSASASAFIYLALNGDGSSSNYPVVTRKLSAAATSDDSSTGRTYFLLGQMGSSAGNSVSGVATIFGANSTGLKPVIITGSASGTGNSGQTGQGLYKGTSVISSISAYSDTGNFDSGTIYIYGSVA
jgi:hypothetical protein